MNDIELQITRTAKELFLKNGYEKTSMSQIAETLGMNRPTLHYYFRTKDKLFEAVAGDIVGLILPNAHSILDTDMPLLDKVSDILDCYLSVLKEHPDLAFFLITECRRDLNHVVRILENKDIVRYIRRIMSMAEEEMARGNLKKYPIHLLGFQVISQMLFPFIVKPIAEKALFESEEAFDAFLKTWKEHIVHELKAILL